jgi:hypothetical protein
MLIDGLNVVKQKLEMDTSKLVQEGVEVNGRMMQPMKISNDVSGLYWVDNLITHWLGGRRDGVMICWDIGTYTYKYDAYTHKLTRVSR